MYSSKDLFQKYKSKRQTQQEVIGYVRVSTEFQSTSVEAQDDIIRKFCKNNDYKLLDIYTDIDEPGKKWNRKGLQAAIKNLEPGMKIISVEQSRISRKALFILLLIEEFEKKNCSLVFINDNIDTSDEKSKLIYSIKAHIDEKERDIISERVIRVMSYKAEEGTLTKKPRYGYKIEDGKVIVNEEEMQLINCLNEIINNDPQIKLRELKKIIEERNFNTRDRAEITNGYINKLIRDNNINYNFRKTKPPYGWKVEEKEWSKNEDEQEVIDSIRALVNENPKMTMTNIVRKLKEQKIYLANGKPFYPGKIAAIIKYNNII